MRSKIEDGRDRGRVSTIKRHRRPKINSLRRLLDVYCFDKMQNPTSHNLIFPKRSQTNYVHHYAHILLCEIISALKHHGTLIHVNEFILYVNSMRDAQQLIAFSNLSTE